MGCASAAASGNGCSGGAIGGTLGSALNSILDPGQLLPPELHVGFMGMAAAIVAGALGQDALAARTAAENETQNNWLKHKAEAFNQRSEADRFKSANAACFASGGTDAASCGAARALADASNLRDNQLSNVCANGDSASCQVAKAEAKASGNDVWTAPDGRTYAFASGDSKILSLDPSARATLLDAQLASPVGAMLSGAVLYGGGSVEQAILAARLGQSLEGMGGGFTSFGTPSSARPVAGGTPSAQPTKENRVDFYVNSQGIALPATGYRYMDSRYAEATTSSMSGPLSYFGFTNFDTGAAARSGFQIFFESRNPASWSDARLKGVFDTLQLFGENGFVNAKVPLINGGAGPGLEPYAKSYPQYGAGGEAQLVPVNKGSSVIFKEIELLK